VRNQSIEHQIEDDDDDEHEHENRDAVERGLT
jgi:hypothetical protein